jgi:hypothetical protein
VIISHPETHSSLLFVNNKLDILEYNVRFILLMASRGSHLTVVLYECETWSLTLRLRVFGNRVLRIFGQKRREVRGGRRKLHNEELHNLYSSPNVIRMIKSRRMRWAGHVARMRRGMHIGYWWGSQKEKTTRKTKT